MKRAKYEDLEIYQLAEKISDRIWEIVIKWNAKKLPLVCKSLIQALV